MCYSFQNRFIYFFLKWTVSGWQYNLNPGGLSRTKLKGKGSRIPFTTTPLITSHNKRIFSTVHKFIVFSLVYTPEESKRIALLGV